MDGVSPIEDFLTGRLREDEFFSAVDRVLADGTEIDRTVLVQDWISKSGRIRRPETRRRLNEKVRPLAWATGIGRRGEAGDWPDDAAVSVRVGDVLANRFVIEAALGTGGMGTVFRALDLRRQEAQDRTPYVAVKTLSPDVLRREDSVQILQREARKAQGLSHPNIVRIYDFDRDGAVLFLTMELLEGVSLERTIRDNGSAGAPLDRILPVIEQIVSALQFAHDEGIVHSDLKPANIIVLTNGRVKVIDFGIARAVPNPNALTADRTTFDINALGAMTPAYASPEMIDGGDPDPRDDVFALACIVFECLTGRHPFGRSPAAMAQVANFTLARPAGMPVQQWTALVNGLAFDRSRRTASPAQFLSELTGKGRQRPSGNRRLIYAGALGIGAVCVAAVAFFYFHDTAAVIRERLGLGSGTMQLAGPSGGAANKPASAGASGTTEAAGRQAQQKAAEEAAAQQARQKAAEEAAAKQAQQKAAEEATAKQAQQKAAEASVVPPTQPDASQIPIGQTQITEAQRLLTAMGLDTGGADGKAGPRTREMVGAFQSAAGEPPTGEITGALLASLQHPPPPATARATSLFTLAAEARRDGHIADAIRLYQSALKLSPKDAGGLLALGDLQRDQADYDAARRAYAAVQRDGGPQADVARQRLAALPAPQQTSDVAPGKATAADGQPTPGAAVRHGLDAGSASHGAPTASSSPPALAANAVGRFDGVYQGASRVVGFSSPYCRDYNGRMIVAGGTLSYQFGTNTMTSSVSGDGSFSASFPVPNSLPAIVLSLSGRIVGDTIDAEIRNIYCKYHLSLKRNP